MRQVIGRYAQNEEWVPPNSPGGPQPVKIFLAMESQMTLHNRDHHRSLIALPVNLLDVVVHLGRQDLTAPGAARFEHPPPILGLHTLAETMDAHAAAFLRLIGTFWHVRNLFQKTRWQRGLDS
jgi:hypothetical protein